MTLRRHLVCGGVNPRAGQSTLVQNLTTQVGQTYDISFYADGDMGSNALTAFFGQTTLSGGPITVPGNGYPNTGPDSNAGAFTHYSFQETATSAFTALGFQAVNDGQNVIQLDNVSVTPVPEASSVISLGLMLCLGLGGVARRKAAGTV